MTEKSIKKDLQILSELFEYIPENIEIVQTTRYSRSLYEEEHQRSIRASTRFSLSQYDQYVKLNNIRKEMLKDKDNQLRVEFKKFLKSLKPLYKVGDIFQEVSDIQAIDPVTETSKPIKWMPKQGIATLIIFWSKESEEWMKTIRNIIEKNQHWNQKIEIVGFIVDGELDEAIQLLRNEQQMQGNTYWFPNDKIKLSSTLSSLDLNKKKQAERKPYIVLLNQTGSIDYLGETASEELVTVIEKYILSGGLKSEYDLMITQLHQTEQKEQYTLLSKAEFKELKYTLRNQMKTYIKYVLNMINSELEVVLTKSNIIQFATKIPQQRTQIMLSYEIPRVYEDQLNEFLTMQQVYVKPEHLLIKKAIVHDYFEQKSKFRLAAEQICQQNGVQIDYQHRRKQIFSFDDNQTIEFTQKSEYITVVAKSTIESAERVAKIATAVRQLKQLINEIDNRIQKRYAWSILSVVKQARELIIGDKFIPIKGYYKADKDIEFIIHVPGQILVIAFGAVWIKPKYCTNSNNCQDLVRFIVLNLDMYKNFLRESGKQHWNYIELYLAKLETCKDNFTNETNYLIVDQNGIIQHLGTLNNLESFVEDLITPKLKQVIEVEKQLISLQQIEQLKQLMNQSIDAFKGFGDKYMFKFDLVINTLYQSDAADAELIKIETPTLEYWVRSKNMDQLNTILTQIFQIIPKEHFKLTEIVSQLFDIPFPGKECTLCKTVLNDQIPQYYSPFKDEFVCVDCADYDDKTQIGLARFKYTDTLIFINAPLTDLSVLQEIDEFKKGKNIQIPEGEAGSQSPGLFCSGCYKQVDGPRYLAISARQGKARTDGFWEYCHLCFAILRDKYSEAAKMIIQRDAKMKMCADTIFLRILFDNGYWTF